MAFTYRNTVQRPLSYAEHDGNLQEIELVYEQTVAARDAAVLATAIFADTTQGLANTTDGEYFTVPSADAAGFLDLYLNDDGTAEFVKQYPSTSGLGTAAAENIGTSGNAIGKLNTENTWASGQIVLGASHIATSSDTGTPALWLGRSSSLFRGGLSYSNTSERLDFFANGVSTARASITSTGLGIGGTAEKALTVLGTVSNAAMRLKETSTYGINWDFDVGSSNRLQISNNAGTVLPTAFMNINVGINTTTPTCRLDVNGDTLRLRTAKTPASATATGNAGDIAWDANYIYVCIATNTWRRTAHATW